MNWPQLAVRVSVWGMGRRGRRGGGRHLAVKRLVVDVWIVADYTVENNAVRLLIGTGTDHLPSNSSRDVDRIGLDTLASRKRMEEFTLEKEICAFSCATWDSSQALTIKAFMLQLYASRISGAVQVLDTALKDI